LGAASVLGRIGGAADEAIAALGQAVGDEAESVRKCAAESLALIGEKAVPTLISCLSNSKPDVQARAAIALGQIGPRAGRAVPSLAPLLCHEDDFVRLQSATALGRIGVRDITVLTDALDAALESRDYRMAESLVIALRETGEKTEDVYTALVGAVFRGHDRVRQLAMSCIKKIDPAAQIQENRKSVTFNLSGGIAARVAAAILFDRWGRQEQ
jgi:HEAT repeat protein